MIPFDGVRQIPMRQLTVYKTSPGQYQYVLFYIGPLSEWNAFDWTDSRLAPFLINPLGLEHSAHKKC